MVAMNCQVCGSAMTSRKGTVLSDHVLHVRTSMYWECPRCGSFCVLARDTEHSGRVLAAGWLLQGSQWPS